MDLILVIILVTKMINKSYFCTIMNSNDPVSCQVLSNVSIIVRVRKYHEIS